MTDGRIWIISNLYVREVESFNKKGENFSDDSFKFHYMYLSNSTLVASNKQKFEVRDGASIDLEYEFGSGSLGKVELSKHCQQRALGTRRSIQLTTPSKALGAADGSTNKN